MTETPPTRWADAPDGYPRYDSPNSRSNPMPSKLPNVVYANDCGEVSVSRIDLEHDHATDVVAYVRDEQVRELVEAVEENKRITAEKTNQRHAGEWVIVEAHTYHRILTLADELKEPTDES